MTITNKTDYLESVKTAMFSDCFLIWKGMGKQGIALYWFTKDEVLQEEFWRIDERSGEASGYKGGDQLRLTNTVKLFNSVMNKGREVCYVSAEAFLDYVERFCYEHECFIGTKAKNIDFMGKNAVTSEIYANREKAKKHHKAQSAQVTCTIGHVLECYYVEEICGGTWAVNTNTLLNGCDCYFNDMPAEMKSNIGTITDVKTGRKIKGNPSNLAKSMTR